MNSPTDKITREVVLDLLPAVRAGTASNDSRALVERYLAQDPELAARAALMPYPSAELELQALGRTRHRLARSQWALALAIFFTALPLSFVANDEGIRWLLLRDAPIFGVASLSAAVGLWIAYFRHRSEI